MTNQLMCIYHANCCDGMGAAWSVHHALGSSREIEFVSATYQGELPDVQGKDVIIVDFSYKRDVMEQLAKEANSVLVLDHHKTAQAELEPLLEAGVIEGKFDMDKSGAVLAWEWFNPDKPIPLLIEHIQDRDLWKFEMPGTREVQAALYSYPMTFSVWDDLMERSPIELYKEGLAIDRAHNKNVAGLVEYLVQYHSFAGYENIPVLNCNYMFASDAVHTMAINAPFSVTYYDTQESRKFSLRSNKEHGIDVSEIAAMFGGGGHKNAAGFKLPLDRVHEVYLTPTE